MLFTTLLGPLALLSYVSAHPARASPGWSLPYSLDPVYPRQVASYCPGTPASEATQRDILYVSCFLLFLTHPHVLTLYPLNLRLPCSHPSSRTLPDPPTDSFALSNAFVTALYINKDVTGAYDKYVAVDLIEHSPFGPQGRDANIAVLLNIIPFADFDVLRQAFGQFLFPVFPPSFPSSGPFSRDGLSSSFFLPPHSRPKSISAPFSKLLISDSPSPTDNSVGFVHLRINTTPEPTALVDIYRFNGTCIVEHWDVTQVKPANATNPIALF